MSNDRHTHSVPLVGCWELASAELVDDVGVSSRPYGPAPRGMLSYLSCGQMSVIIVGNADRFVSDDLFSAHDMECSNAFKKCVAYFGTYSFEPESSTVTHYVVASWFPNLPSPQVRNVKFRQDMLELSSPLMQLGGRPQTLIFRWKAAQSVGSCEGVQLTCRESRRTL